MKQNQAQRTRVETDFFRRPVVFCLLAYIVGLWITRDIYPVAATGFSAIIIGIVAVAAVVSISRRDSTYLLLCVFLAFGAARVSSLTNERAEAARMAEQLRAIDLPRHFTATVALPHDAEDRPYQRIILSQVTLISTVQHIDLPG